MYNCVIITNLFRKYLTKAETIVNTSDIGRIKGYWRNQCLKKSELDFEVVDGNTLKSSATTYMQIYSCLVMAEFACIELNLRSLG